MKSFRLQIEDRKDLLLSLLWMAMGALIVLVSYWLGVGEVAAKTMMLLSGAFSVGFFARGHACRALRHKYPNARWIPLVAIGLAFASFLPIAMIVLPKGISNGAMLPFVLAAGGCLATFVIRNRHDPDVFK